MLIAQPNRDHDGETIKHRNEWEKTRFSSIANKNDVLNGSMITGNIALNKCVISLDPWRKAASPSVKSAIECPTDTVIFCAVNSSITSSAFCFSGARVIIATLSKLPYVSSTVDMPFDSEHDNVLYVLIHSEIKNK